MRAVGGESGEEGDRKTVERGLCEIADSIKLPSKNHLNSTDTLLGRAVECMKGMKAAESLIIFTQHTIGRLVSIHGLDRDSNLGLPPVRRAL